MQQAKLCVHGEHDGAYKVGIVTAGSYGSATAVSPAHALCTLGPRVTRQLRHNDNRRAATVYDAKNTKSDKPWAESCWWVECVRVELEGFPRGDRV